MQRASATRGLRFLPKLAFITTVGLITAATSYQALATDVFTDPVGFISYTAVPHGLSFFGFSMTRLPALRGVTGAAVGTKIPINATLTIGQFNPGPTNYFFEITSGPNAGFLDDVVSNDTGNVFTLFDDSAIVTANATYKIYPHWSPDTVFGTPTQSGLVGGSSALAADNVIVWDPVHQAGATYFYRTNTNGAGPGWRGPQGLTTPAGTNTWYLDQGVQVLRLGGTTNLIEQLVGGVKLGPTLVPIAAGPNGLTFPGFVYATSTTMDGAGLFTTNSATGVLGGSSALGADNVIIWNAVAQAGATYFWRTNTNGAGPSWRGPQGLTTPAGTNVIAIGSIFKILRASGGSFNWDQQQPY